MFAVGRRVRTEKSWGVCVGVSFCYKEGWGMKQLKEGGKTGKSDERGRETGKESHRFSSGRCPQSAASQTRQYLWGRNVTLWWGMWVWQVEGPRPSPWHFQLVLSWNWCMGSWRVVGNELQLLRDSPTSGQPVQSQHGKPCTLREPWSKGCAAAANPGGKRNNSPPEMLAWSSFLAHTLLYLTDVAILRVLLLTSVTRLWVCKSKG